jgi:hypothetical protein
MGGGDAVKDGLFVTRSGREGIVAEGGGESK